MMRLIVKTVFWLTLATAVISYGSGRGPSVAKLPAASPERQGTTDAARSIPLPAARPVPMSSHPN